MFAIEMQNKNYNTVKRRLSIVTIVTIVTGILGILSILEVARGVRFHESNIQHLALTSRLKDKVDSLHSHSTKDINEVRQLLEQIRIEPAACLNSMNDVLVVGLKMLGTIGIRDICKEDLRQLDMATAYLKRYEMNVLDWDSFILEFDKITTVLHQHSLDFRPPVSRTLNFLLLVAGIMILLKAFTVTLVSMYSSRSIMRHFNSLLGMENQLRVKNDELNLSINELELQKTELEVAQQLAEHNSLHDSLTELPNRRYLENTISSYLNDDKELAIYHIGIDGLKQINDTKGHNAGDHVLCHTATELKRISDEKHFISRVGGDEFVVVQLLESDSSHYKSIEQFAAFLVDTLGKPISYRGFSSRMSVSVGIAVRDRITGLDMDYSSMLINADLALYRSKTNGRNGYAFYDAKLHAEMAGKKEIADQIQSGLTRSEFIPYFQPQFASGSFQLTGVEALVRWQHPTRGTVFPDEFLPVAEEMGVIGEIDQQVFEKAFEYFESWQSMGIKVPRLSVNVSYKRLTDQSLLNQLEKFDIGKGQLSFEILETTLLDNTDNASRVILESLTEMGIELELDDFGSGHASILALLELKPDRFKIDRQLISNMHESASQKALVRSIIDIGKSLDLEVIAEGIECIEHAKMLEEMGCNMLQGYYFSKPISNEHFIEFVTQKKWLDAA